MGGETLLEVKSLRRTFGGLVAVKDASLSVRKGSVVSLVGPNGAGKTTLFNMVCGQLRPTAGTVLFEGRDVTNLKPHQLAGMGVGRTFQDPRIFDQMTVEDHIVAALPLKGENPLRALFRGPSYRAEREAALATTRKLLAQIGLEDRRHEQAQELPFGDQRFLSIFRTLARDPKLLLMDEPTVGLDSASLERLHGLIRRMVNEDGKTVLLVEHNLRFVFTLSDYIYLLVDGQIVLSGTPDEVSRHPQMIEAYLGTQDVAGIA